MTTVLVFGTFDVIHSGHKWFLKKASRLGDRLIAVVSRDDFVKEWKGRSPLMDERSRIKALQSSGLVDDAILSDREIRTYGVLEEIKPDIICLGHDQKSLMEDLFSKLENGEIDCAPPKIEILPPWRRRLYSSTRLNQPLGGADRKAKGQWGLIILAVLAMTAFGFSWVSGKRISALTTPPLLTFLRFLLTSVCFLPFFFFRKSPCPTGKSLLFGMAWTFAASIAITSYNLLFFLGLGSGLAGKGGLIVTTLNPLFTFTIASIASKSRPGLFSIAALVLGIAGGFLLLEPWTFTVSEFADSSNLLFLAAALCWSLLTLTGRKAQSHMGFGLFNAGLYIFSSLLILPFALKDISMTLIRSFDSSFWFDLGFIAIIVGAFGTGVYFIASTRLGAAKGSAFTYLVPVSALIFTAVLLDERPKPFMLLGGLLAISAVTLMNKSEDKRR